MIRADAPRVRTVYQVNCPGCGKRLKASSEDARRARVLVHIRNCNALNREAALLPLDEPPAEATK